MRVTPLLGSYFIHVHLNKKEAYFFLILFICMNYYSISCVVYILNSVFSNTATAATVIIFFLPLNKRQR